MTAFEIMFEPPENATSPTNVGPEYGQNVQE